MAACVVWGFVGTALFFSRRNRNPAKEQRPDAHPRWHPARVCSVAGYATAGAATWYSLRKINQREDPQAGVPAAALLTAGFFVASWIHIPIPPTSVHLVLNGLLGAVLGYYAFPAILIGLFFQAVMFQHGGLSTLGVNATIMGVPALIAYLSFACATCCGAGATARPGATGP